MKLKTLLKEIPSLEVKGSRDIELTGICSHSKKVSNGSLFVAKRGKTFDGANYIPDAIASGAAAILTDLFDPTLKNITQIVHPKLQEVEWQVAKVFYGNPAQKLFMTGITGTNGKTTSAYLVKNMLDQLIGQTGLIGTIEYIIGDHRYPPTHTTPDVSTNYKLLKEMVQEGCKSCVMEVTSHALDQGRVKGIDYNAAIFTNLTQDHLDYHKTMEHYADSKAKLFSTLNKDSVAILNQDSAYSDLMAKRCIAKKMTYGIEGICDVRASNIRMDGAKTECTITYKGKSLEFNWPLSGRYNIYNALGCIALGLSLNASLETLQQIMRSVPPVPGRLERIDNKLGIDLFVDFAHTDDALANVLSTLNETKKGKLIVVFGCGGDRDKAKRPLMAEAAEKGADLTIVTSDNPRSEKPEAIISDILKGFKNRESYQVQEDRKEAINAALKAAKPGDTVLIAGRGHEPYQIFAHQTIEFDDRKVARECLDAF